MAMEFTMTAVKERIAATIGVPLKKAEELLRSAQNGKDLNFLEKTQPMPMPVKKND